MPRRYLELGRSLTEIKDFGDPRKVFDQRRRLADKGAGIEAGESRLFELQLPATRSEVMSPPALR
jgi:hypothetical protein